MFKKRLNQEDLEELRKRDSLAREHSLIAEALEIQKQVWLKGILPKYGLDMNKNYTIDLKTGVIKIYEQPANRPGNRQ